MLTSGAGPSADGLALIGARTLARGLDHNGLIHPADIVLFVNIWFAAAASGGCGDGERRTGPLAGGGTGAKMD